MFRDRFLVILLLAGGTLSLYRASAKSRSQDTLQSFYIARFYFSDLLSSSSEQITDVTPQGDGVRVRVIRISQANSYCPSYVVRAAERVFPRTSTKKIAGRDLCEFTTEGVDAALKAAAPKHLGDNSDSAAETIVAKCGDTQREFNFPYPVEVDLKALEHSSPKISDLWDTNYRVIQRSFGKKFSFNGVAPEQEKEMEQLGTEFVPDLISGKYQTAYAGSKCGEQDCDNYLAWQLKGYIGAPLPVGPLVGTLLDADSLHFAKYVSPIMPAIALVAHVSGDVHLRILADAQTGMVTNVQSVSGSPLLVGAAVKAAYSWQFAQGSLSGEPLEVTLRFELNCS
jgi:hypothetical protein